MSVTTSVTYSGNLQCRLVHGPSGAEIETSAPKDNQGDGSLFSPTDLVGAALGSCVLTILGIVAKKRGFSIEGAHAQVIKEMSASPRRISRLALEVHLPRALEEAESETIERAAHGCPVRHSLHPETEVSIKLIYDID